MVSNEVSTKDMKWLRWCAAGAPVFSTCIKAQYLAVILDVHGHVIGTGYNGSPRNTLHCVDGGCPRASNGVPAGTPYDYGPGQCVAIHAEANALLYSDFTARIGGTLYVNGHPCFSCAKLIANSGLARCVFIAEPERIDSDDASALMRSAGITVVGVSATVFGGV